ncbi:hypothetical protein [Flavobacterium restrictum]|uniref:DUF1735 domain-containing protein n=1 Tax=Flavobacterium restrictum TaxID=2594428 RepID=A0A553E8N7_9FLAO|nr:hypothetical protein [Flavobacterium restrictum]TRX41424.1 hypothetical protein FNW21_04815 [Flavobacterium restrictum]
MMFKKSFRLLLGLLALGVFSYSCSSDLDFNQANTLELRPIVVANLAAFDVPAHQFVTNGVENPIGVDVPTVDLFSTAFFKDNLDKTDLFFEINNTINRKYTVEMYFLNSKDAPLYSIKIPVPAYSGTEQLVTKTETFQGTNLNFLKNTKKIAFVVKMLAGPPLTETSLGSLQLRSSVTAYFIVK